MRNNIAIILLSCVSTFLSAQTDLDLEELSPVEHAKIVLLGEQTHFDGAAFDKKVEIIKQLHKKMGFNIIVFESGLYDNYRAHQLYKSKKESIAIYNQSIFSIWAETTAFKELLDYVSQNPEMKILGFDNQESSLFKEHFIPDLKKLLNQNSINLSNKTYTQIEKTLVYRDLDEYINNEKDSLALYKTFDDVKNHISKIDTKNLDAKIIEQTFRSVVADFDFALKVAQEEKVYVQNPRDKQMAENFIFLQNQFPNEKFIGWGASYHFANEIDNYDYSDTTENYITKLYNLSAKLTSHNHSSLEEEVYHVKELRNATPMGRLLKEKYGNQLYSIGFTSYNGTYFGSDNIEFPILEPPNNSLETILFKKKTKARLIDKKKFPKNDFYTSVLGYLPIKANWNVIFDGIYYIPEMYPPKYRDYNEVIDTTIVIAKKTFEGVVRESESNNPIPYIDVYYALSNKSTIANSKGEFSLLKSTNPDDYLVFSSFGFASDSIQVKEITSSKPIKVTLRKLENVTFLNEVVVESELALSAKEILKNAQKRIEDNYVQTPFNQNFFYKVQGFRNDTLLFNEEALLESYFKKGNTGTNNPENQIFANVLQLRNTTNNYSEKKESGIGNLWPIINRDVILSKTNVLYRPASYELKKEGLVTYNGKEVYRISFINNSPGSYSTGYGYPAPVGSSGIIFIDKESFAVLYYEHCVAREEYTPKRSKYKFQSFHKIIQSYKEVEGKYFSNLFKVVNKSNFYSKTNGGFLGSSYGVNYLMSTDIDVQNIKMLTRPIKNIKQHIKLKSDPNFWDINTFYIEDNDFEYEGCEY